jgi:hypothetical protein
MRSPSQKFASRIAMSGWVFCSSSVSMKCPYPNEIVNRMVAVS